jgi:hypothetical protein
MPTPFMNTFRVLVLDDSRELIAKISKRLIFHPQNIDGAVWRVVLHEVYVEVTVEKGLPQFSEETLRRIVEECRERPHLILADYGFIAPEHSNLPPQQYFERALTPATLIPALRSYLEKHHLHDIKVQAETESNFIQNACPLYLYTYTGKDFRGVDPTPDQRANLVHRAFNQSQVRLVDISQELFQNDAFSGDDKDFRAFLTAGLLAGIIERELLTFAFRDEKARLKYVRFRRSGVGVLVIVVLGGAIGALGEWFGSTVIAMLEKGFVSYALALGILAALFLFLLGLGVPLFFERLMSNLLSKVKSNESSTLHETLFSF